MPGADSKTTSAPLIARLLARFAGSDRTWPGAAGVLALTALWPLLQLDHAAPGGSVPMLDAQEAERFFFEPHQSSPALILVIAGALAWLRWPRFCGISSPGRPIAAGIAYTLSLALGAWAARAGASHVLVFAAMACVAGFALGARGWPGLRVLSVPLAILLFAVPVPSRLSNELIWELQIATAAGTEQLLGLLGLDVVRDGVFLRRGESGFLVIESCSGFRSLHILAMVALMIGELDALGRRTLVLLVATPAVACGLNVLRIAWIVLENQDPAEAVGHLGQGLVVLSLGTGILFGIGRLLGAKNRTGDPSGEDPSGLEPGAPSRNAWRVLALMFAAMALLVHAITPWPPARPERIQIEGLFAARGKWAGEDLVADRIFIGSVGIGRTEFRRMTYEGSLQTPPGVVEAFVAAEARGYPRRSPVSDLLLLPSREWGIRSKTTRRDWRMFRDVEEAIVSRGDEHMLVRLWTLGVPDPLVSFFRSLLGLDRGPFALDRERVVVRLATPVDPRLAGNVELGRSLLDQFVLQFRTELESLES